MTKLHYPKREISDIFADDFLPSDWKPIDTPLFVQVSSPIVALTQYRGDCYMAFAGSDVEWIGVRNGFFRLGDHYLAEEFCMLELARGAQKVINIRGRLYQGENDDNPYIAVHGFELSGRKTIGYDAFDERGSPDLKNY